MLIAKNCRRPLQESLLDNGRRRRKDSLIISPPPLSSKPLDLGARSFFGSWNLELGAFSSLLLATLCLFPFQPLSAQPPRGTNSLPEHALSLADALNLALRQNPNVLRAQKDLEANHGIVIQTRAILIPKIQVTGNYKAVEPNDVDKPPVTIPGFASLGTDQSWSTQIRLVQSIYEGGRMASSLRVAKLQDQKAVLDLQTVLADTTLEVQIAYDDVLLASQQIVVQEASVALLQRELTDTSRRFEAGTVPRFNVLRAEVELANAQPKLIRARNGLKLAKNNLANLLGFDVPRETGSAIPLDLSGKLQADPYQIELPRALALALQRRTELASLRKAEALRKEDVVTAKAGRKPSLQLFGGYDAHSSLFGPDLTDEVHGWITGVELSWHIFDGLRTKGKVQETTALYERAGVDVTDSMRRIELEVRTAYLNLVEADEVLKSQEKAVEQAQEALRLANARAEAGTGTQLDVLGAQTSLTEARTNQAQALHDYSVARARLQHAIGVEKW